MFVRERERERKRERVCVRGVHGRVFKCIYICVIVCACMCVCIFTYNTLQDPDLLDPHLSPHEILAHGIDRRVGTHV